MIINSTYFHDETGIPGLTTADGVTPNIVTVKQAQLTRAINTYEPKFLELVMGGDMYDDYTANKTDERWTAFEAKLRNETLLTSPVADYVFWYLWKAICQPYSGIGSSVPVAKDAVILPYTSRTVPAWNHMAREMRKFFKWLEENLSTYEINDLSFDRSNWSALCSPANDFGL